MSAIECVADFPDEGFSILKDNHGRFLAFRDKESILPIDDEPEINYRLYMKPNPFDKRVPAIFHPKHEVLSQ